MAKKFGKIVLGAITVTAAVAGAYYYLTQKDAERTEDYEDEDFDSFDVDFDEKESSRNYTTLNSDSATKEPSHEEELVNQAKDITASATETVKEANQVIENFFDDTQN